MEDQFLPDSILFCDLSDRMIAIIHPIQTRRIHLYMSEEHLIASTVQLLCRGMRYPNCDIRALFMISINFYWRHVDIPRARCGPARYHGRTADALAQGADEGRGKLR